MKRPASERINKYRKKIDGAIAGKRYDDTKELSVRSQKDYFKRAEQIQVQVKSIVSSEPSIYHIYYMVFAEELVTKTQSNEWQILYDKWTTRGLKTQILNKISELLVGWSPVIIPPPPICLFDVGRFDVNGFG